MPTALPLPPLPALALALASPDAPQPGLRIGVDTHADLHVAAAIDELGRLCATISIPTTLAGLRRLHLWAHQLAGQLGGPVVAWGIEGTGSYGARLARLLTDHGETILEVSRPTGGCAATAASPIRSTPRPPRGPC